MRCLVGPGRRADQGDEATFSGRCRAVAADVASHHAGVDDEMEPPEGPEGLAWLEAALREAASTPGTVAQVLTRSLLSGAGASSLPSTLRTVAWLRLGMPEARAWRRGLESEALWSLLLSPAPADEHELWWLATSHRLSAAQLRAVLRPPPGPAAPERRRQTSVRRETM